MRRTATPPEPPTESFSGLLERLARLAQRTHSTGISLGGENESQPNPPAPRRQPVPIPQLKNSRAKSTDAVPLSYESALRAHSRYRPSSSKFPIPPAQAANASPPPQQKTTNPAPIPSSSRSIAQAAPASKPIPVADAKRPATAVNPPRPRSRSMPQPLQNPVQTSAKSSTKPPARKSPTSSPTNSNRRAQYPASTATRQTNATASEGKVASIAPRPLHHHLLALDLKQTTISVRLSNQDSDRIRLRAAESGMTVSAYMRSCVLDAEHLRDQVKQALAEMRARAIHPEPALLPASAHGGNFLLRLLAKPAAFFFGPWLPQRRSA